MNDDGNDNAAGNYNTNNSKTTRSKSFKYKTKIIWSMPTENDI